MVCVSAMAVMTARAANANDRLDRGRAGHASVRAAQGNKRLQEHLAPAWHIYLVMDAGSPVAAFTAKHEMKAYLKRRLGTFSNPLVYTFGDIKGRPL